MVRAGMRTTSPLAIAGRSTAFEGVVNVSLRQDDVSTPLFEGTVMGGGMGLMAPFHLSIAFGVPSHQFGALVLYTISAKDGSVVNASVIRVRLR